MAFLALVFAMGGFAIASNEQATTSAKKKVKSCYSKKTGDLRVAVKGERTCRRSEKKLVLNKRGLRGPVGARGAIGPAGAQGSAGPQGPAGLSGGSGGGGVTLGPGVIGTEHLSDGLITAPKLAPNLITDNLLGLKIEYAESDHNSTGVKSISAGCPAGTLITGGGGGATDGLFIPLQNPALATIYNGPIVNARGWSVTAAEVVPLATSWTLIAYAICIRD
jgi:hypothetical protein